MNTANRISDFRIPNSTIKRGLTRRPNHAQYRIIWQVLGYRAASSIKLRQEAIPRKFSSLASLIAAPSPLPCAGGL